MGNIKCALYLVSLLTMIAIVVVSLTIKVTLAGVTDAIR